MKLGTVALTAAITAAFAAVFWSRSSLQERIREVDRHLAAVTDGFEPVHLRCEVLEGMLVEADGELAEVRREAADLSGTVASQAEFIAEGRQRLKLAEQRLTQALDDADRRSFEILATLDNQAQETGSVGKRIAELGLELQRVEQDVASLPAGAILPWLPDQGGLPQGWLICDGTRGTPDLRGLFLRGVGRLDEAGRYFESAKMGPAGLHSHATELSRNVYSLVRSRPKTVGDWLMLFDAGIGDNDPGVMASHGQHVHEDEHVPAHYTVVFIMKELG
jgi:hypothetical protein